MNVFVLSTGRCGSTTLARACSHICNFTSAHESNRSKPVMERLDYPPNHIEIDNRLSWFLGELANRYGSDAYYVHLKRAPESVAESFMHRWRPRGSIIRGFGRNILCVTEQTIDVARLYVSCVNSNIEHFLYDKPHSMTIELEHMEEHFAEFWSWIEAEGDLDQAIEQLRQPHNSTPRSAAAHRVRQVLRAAKRSLRGNS